MSPRSCGALLAMLALAACQAPVRPDAPAPAGPAPAEAPAAVPPAPRTVMPAPEVPLFPAPPSAPAPAEPAPLRAADLFERLRTRLADPPCVQDRVVQRWERIYARHPPRLRANLEAILPLLALVLDELEGHHLPTEFALLPIVESWYRPDAGAPRSAYGMWQFTGSTARLFGLRVAQSVDERLVPHRATRAAVNYLAVLHNEFGDWKLANMAFNAGEYRLKRALARAPVEQRHASAAAHHPPGLSMTTYEHVAKVQALACLLAEPARFGLELPADTIVEPLRAVAAPAGVASLADVARRAALDEVRVRQLNPAWRRHLPRGASLLLPRSAAERLVLARPAPPAAVASAGKARPGRDPAAPAREHRVERGDTLGAIAQRYGVALADLLRWNGLDARGLIHPGQRLRLEP